MKTAITLAAVLSASVSMASLPPSDRTVFDKGIRADASTETRDMSYKSTPDQNTLDMQLIDRVQQQLRASVEHYNSADYKVSTNGGEVTIIGRVRNYEELDAILTNVRMLGGVATIKNQIVVDPKAY